MTSFIIDKGNGQDAWDVLAEVSQGVSNVALMVRYPSGDLIPVAVPHQTSARMYRPAIEAMDGYVVEAVRVNGVEVEVGG